MKLIQRSQPRLFGKLDNPTKIPSWADALEKYDRNSKVRLGKNESEGFSAKQLTKSLDPTPPWRRNTIGHQTLRELRRRFMPGIALDHVRYNDQCFPDHQFILLVDSCVEPTTQLQFYCPTYLTNLEIKMYLERIYGFRIDFVSSRIVAPLASRDHGTFSLTGRTLYMTTHQPRRLASVHLLEEVSLPSVEHFDTKPMRPELLDEYVTNSGEMPDPRVMRKSFGAKWKNTMGPPDSDDTLRQVGRE